MDSSEAQGAVALLGLETGIGVVEKSELVDVLLALHLRPKRSAKPHFKSCGC